MNKKTLQITALLLAATTAPLYCGKKGLQPGPNQPKITNHFQSAGVRKRTAHLRRAVLKTQAEQEQRAQAQQKKELREREEAQRRESRMYGMYDSGSDSAFVTIEHTPLTPLQKLEQEQLFLQRRVNNWGRSYEPDTTAADMKKLSEVEKQIAQMKKQ